MDKETEGTKETIEELKPINKIEEKKNFGSISIEKVIVVNLTVGQGTKDSPLRGIKQYWTIDGKFLCETKW